LFGDVLADDEDALAHGEVLIGKTRYGNIKRGVRDGNARCCRDDPTHVLIRVVAHFDNRRGEAGRNVVEARVCGFAQQFVDAEV
jgi:hypothetical protein